MESSLSAGSYKYSAFISYSHEDDAWAKWLQRVLETYRVPSRLVGTQTAAGTLPRRLAPVFRDRSDLPSATDLGANINEALGESANLIVVCSPSASTSHWVNEEIRAFRRLGRGDRIFCLIVAGEPNASDLPGRQSEECFVPALRYLDGTEGQLTGQRFEPIAADARAGGDGKTNVKLKILSGLLDVGFDELKRREHRRRYQRMTAVASLAVVVMLITTGLAIDALVARKAAEQRQKEAENLVAFMLGDLNDKLRQVQRLDILEAVDNHAMAYFLSRPIREVSEQTLMLRVKALQKIGNVREDQGKLPAAMESYGAASTLAAELVRRAPGDSEREAVYAETLNHIGNGYWFEGDLDHALGSFQRAIVLLKHSTAVRPSNSALAALSSARTNAGRVLEARGDFEAARTLYEAVLATYKTLASRQPDEARWQSNLADAYDSLGKIALEQGELTRAISAYRDVRGIKAQLLANGPGDRNVQESLLLSNAILGRTLALCGANEAASRYVNAAVSAARVLVAFDATQADWREELALYNLMLGGFARSAGRFGEAAGRDGESMRVLGELVSKDKTNNAWRQELARVQVESGRLQLALGEFAQAEQSLAMALGTITADRKATPVDRSLRLLEAEGQIVMGQIAVRRNDRAAAREHWTQALEAIGSVARVGADPNVLAARASALLLLDDTGAAGPVVGQLASMGYRTHDFDVLLAAKQQIYPIKSLAVRCGSNDLAATAGREVE